MATKLDQLKDKLRELFQLDRPDLDFGFYRVMHAKQDEIERFLDKDLLPQVQAGLDGLKANGGAELAEAIKQAEALGVDPDSIPKVQALKAKLGEPIDAAKVEDSIYSHLFRFFARYYDAGDFLSMRRYKEGVYAIPYEGEEVVLHWANKDQYYIKSSENLRDYTVRLAESDDAPRLHFKLVEADIEKDNRKAAADKKRIFIFNPEKTEVLDNEVILGFEYRADPDNRKQESFITACVDYVREHAADFGPIAQHLLALKPTDKKKTRTLLEKHLTDYTATNTMDYFIHKDLGGFLRRELDFYIKNEVMHLDDIEHETAPRVEQYLVQIKVLRGIAHKLIDFLDQLEEFQKKLWLKKKFVVESNWCITLDRVPEALYPEIAKNEAQWAEWEKLGFILEGGKKTAGELGLGDQTIPKKGTVEYLKAFPYMVIDTAFYDSDFKQKLLAAIDNIDEQTDGLLIHSENFQALELLQERYKEQVKCVYIDPPYNTDASAILYKNGYKSSTWCSLMNNGLAKSRALLTENGVLVAAIDDEQQKELGYLIDSEFQGNMLGTICVRSNPSGRPTQTGYAVSHEYLYFAGKTEESSIGRLPPTEDQTRRFNQRDETGIFEWRNLRREGSNSDRNARRALYYPIYIQDTSLRVPEMTWDKEEESWVIEEEPKKGEKVVYPDNEDGVQKTWRWGDKKVMNSLSELAARKDRSGKDYPYCKRRPNEAGVVSVSSWFDSKYSATEHGTAILKALFYKNPFDYPKSIHAVTDSIYVGGSSGKNTTTLDYFGGSGTTGHAVINLNREDEGKRKYVLVEMGEHFNTVTKPRIQKVVFSKDWKEGRPINPKSGVSHCFKYIRLESYEDCLNNLELKRTTEQDDLLNRSPALKEDYTLRYMLDVESKNSLLNVAAFADPFAYTLKVATGSIGETKPVQIDLVETFNFLIGLKVRTMDSIKGITVLTGENLAGDKVLVLWRTIAETNSEALNDWFVKQGYSTLDMEFDLIYVNGDNNLENLRKDEQSWKVRLIEEEFARRMFAEEAGI